MWKNLSTTATLAWDGGTATSTSHGPKVIPPDDRRMVYQLANMLWHSDSSFKPVPSLCSLLSARIVPPEGGATEFASGRCARTKTAPIRTSPSPVGFRSLMVDVAVVHQLLEVVGDVGAEIIAAVGEFADRQHVFADVEQDHRLDVVEVPDALPVEIGLDHFKALAVQALDDGASVLVAAPTGSGKTVVAEHAVARALAEGGKAFYTTPIKALSNQKYHDLVKRYGADKVFLADLAVIGERRERQRAHARSYGARRRSAFTPDHLHELHPTRGDPGCRTSRTRQ